MGRSHPVKQMPDRLDSQTSPGINEHRPGISEHFRAFSDMRGSSRAVSPVAGSRAVGLVACGIARRRTRRREWSSRAVWPVARSRLVASLPVVATSVSLPCPRLGIPKVRRLPCPGPTAPVADAASGGLRTFILLHGRGVQSRFSRRRG